MIILRLYIVNLRSSARRQTPRGGRWRWTDGAKKAFHRFRFVVLAVGCNNILLDNKFNITDILDWSRVQTVPVEQFAATSYRLVELGFEFGIDILYLRKACLCASSFQHVQCGRHRIRVYLSFHKINSRDSVLHRRWRASRAVYSVSQG